MIHDKIAKLPEWPNQDEYVKTCDAPTRIPGKTLTVTYTTPALDLRLANDQLEWALARLTLAREWIEGAHGRDCSYDGSYEGGECSCEQAEVLAAITQPGQKT
jgi:hypothetical protein